MALTTDEEAEDPYGKDDVLKALVGAAWESEKNRFGLLTYGALEEAGIVSRDGGAFAQAARLMLPVDDTGADKLVYTSNPVNLRGVNLEEWGEDKKKLIDELTRLTPCLIGAVADETEVEELTGSFSYRVGNIVYARIMYLKTENTVVLALLKDPNIPQFVYGDEFGQTVHRVQVLYRGGRRAFPRRNKRLFQITTAKKRKGRSSPSFFIFPATAVYQRLLSAFLTA